MVIPNENLAPRNAVLTQEQAAALYNLSTRDVASPRQYYYDPTGKTPDPYNRKSQQDTMKTEPEKHTERLIHQFKTGSPQERQWAKQALAQQGFKFSGGIINRKQARALWIASGGKPSEFQYNPANSQYSQYIKRFEDSI